MPLPAISHRWRRRLAHGGSIVVLGLLTGCAEGDFGRIRSSLVTDDMHAWIGAEAVGSIGGTPSRYGLTDDERALRDLAYPLIEAPFDRQRWYSILGEYGFNRIRNAPFDRTAYSRQLMLRPARSASMRYALLLEDIRNDIVRIGPFFRTAARVADMDDKRAKSLPYIGDLSEEERANALSRIAENQLAVGWVQHSLHQRVEGYRYALERLVIEYPSPMAVEAEQLLGRLRLEIGEIHLVAVQPPPRMRVSK
ncbi:MAG TPA: hypothetical protein VFK79_01090 [Xanthobacteraceae bacterium]|nr:hypothetical protein [Xanthobacteraceae bacterium]